MPIPLLFGNCFNDLSRPFPAMISLLVFIVSSIYHSIVHLTKIFQIQNYKDHLDPGLFYMLDLCHPPVTFIILIIKNAM